jgi:hypothetical protein
LRRFTLACAGLLACCVSIAGASQAAGKNEAPAAAKPNTRRLAAISWLGKQVDVYERTTWRWQRTMGVRRTPTAGRVLAEMSVPDVKRAAALWRGRARHARARAQHPPHLHAFLCIHRYEGSWRDAGAPYYGGLQMNIGFQRTYGPHLLRTKGTADHWTPLEQIWTAERAARRQGFRPWPNTARSCGLI